MIYSLVVQKWIEIRANGVHVRAYWSGKNTAAMDEGTSPETVYRYGTTCPELPGSACKLGLHKMTSKAPELDGRGHEGRDQTFPGRWYGASTESTSLWSCRGLSPNLTETNIDAAIWAVTEDLRSTIKNTSSPCLYDHLYLEALFKSDIYKTWYSTLYLPQPCLDFTSQLPLPHKGFKRRFSRSIIGSCQRRSNCDIKVLLNWVCGRSQIVPETYFSFTMLRWCSASISLMRGFCNLEKR